MAAQHFDDFFGHRVAALADKCLRLEWTVPQPPRETVQVKAMHPERDALEIRFPRVEGYRVELPEERLTADFNEDSILVLSPDIVGVAPLAICR